MHAMIFAVFMCAGQPDMGLAYGYCNFVEGPFKTLEACERALDTHLLPRQARSSILEGKNRVEWSCKGREISLWSDAR